MSIDFLIGAIRASRDLHPQVKTELEEILNMVQQDRKPDKDCTTRGMRFGLLIKAGKAN